MPRKHSNNATKATMHSDSKATIAQLKRVLKRFRDQRDWAIFHDPKNLAEAISIEASELLQLFLWKNPHEIAHEIQSNQGFRMEIEEELADVFCFSLNLANALNVDVSQIVLRKIEHNRRKYPIAKAKGKATKYNKL